MTARQDFRVKKILDEKLSFGFDVDPIREESKFIKIRDSRLFSATKAISDFLMKLSSLKLCDTIGKENQSNTSLNIRVRDNLRPENPFEFLTYENLSKLRHGLQSRSDLLACLSKLYNLMRFLLLLYLFLKFVLIAYYQVQRELILQSWEPRVLKNAHRRTEKCAFREDIHYGHLNTSYQMNANDYLQQITEKLEHLGCPIPSLNGNTIIIFAVLPMVPLIFYFSYLVFVPWFELKASIYSFLYEPMTERRRVREEFTLVTSGMIRALINKLSDQQREISKAKYREIRFRTSSSAPLSSTTSSDSSTDSDDFYEADQYKSSNISIKALIKLVLKIHHLDLVRPANLTTDWFAYLLPRKFLFLIIGSWNGFFSCVLIVSGLTVLELYSRANQRLAITECELMTLNGSTYIREDKIKLVKLDSSDQEIYANYLMNNRNTDSFSFVIVEMGVKIESKYFLTRNVIQCLVEMLVTLAFCGPIVCFSFSTYCFAYIDKAYWLRQLLSQTDYCITLLEDHISISSQRKEGIKYFDTILLSNFLETKSYNHIVEMLTITYLNFELFRRQNKSYQMLIGYTMIQVSALTFGTVSVCYVVGTIVSIGSKGVLLLLSTYLMLVFDVYMCAGAVRTAASEKLMKNFMRIIMAAQFDRRYPKSALKFSTNEIIQLYRRQILTNNETKRLFAPKILGMELSYQKLMTYNFWLIIFWIILLKVNL